eukprot:TRINITY_DN3525_c0_g1_i1.p1 TRINITY_DN3525_c0_g1~~TRINITY_DN3525_c0_g1_i1.p1  ORF type:complete len:607 (-),score=61.01 TRINITY_DN3525_c0_g1_i1:123-1943(-)
MAEVLAYDSTICETKKIGADNLVDGQSLRDIYCQQCDKLKCKRNSNLLKMLPADRYSLRELDLNLNFVGRVGVKAVLQVALAAPKLQKLCIADNFLSNDCVRHLTNTLSTHPSLHYLDLSANPISHVSGKALNEFVTNNVNIFSIVLKDTLINPALIKMINKKGQHNRVTFEKKHARKAAGSQLAAAQDPTASAAAPTPTKYADDQTQPETAIQLSARSDVSSETWQEHGTKGGSYNLACLSAAALRLQDSLNADPAPFPLIQRHLSPNAQEHEGVQASGSGALVPTGRYAPLMSPHSGASVASGYSTQDEELPQLNLVFKMLTDPEASTSNSTDDNSHFPALHQLQTASLPSPRKPDSEPQAKSTTPKKEPPKEQAAQQQRSTGNGKPGNDEEELAVAMAPVIADAQTAVSAAPPPPTVPGLAMDKARQNSNNNVNSTSATAATPTGGGSSETQPLPEYTFNAVDLLFQTVEKDVNDVDDDAYIPLRLVCDVARRHKQLNTSLAPVILKSPRSNTTTVDDETASSTTMLDSARQQESVSNTEGAIGSAPEGQQWYGMNLVWHYVTRQMQGGDGIVPPSPSKGWSALTQVVKVINMEKQAQQEGQK